MHAIVSSPEKQRTRMRSESFSRRSSIVTETIKEDEDPANEDGGGEAKEDEQQSKFVRSAPPTPGGTRSGVEEKVPLSTSNFKNEFQISYVFLGP